MEKIILQLAFLLIIANCGISECSTLPVISVYSGRWTWRAKIEYENDFIRCIFRDSKISPFLSRVSLTDKKAPTLIENCGPSIQKFEKVSIEYKGEAFTILCENPVPETAIVPFWKTKGILVFPGNKPQFSMMEEIKVLKKGKISLSSFNFDLHGASPIAVYTKKEDRIEKTELVEHKEYKFQIGFDFMVIVTKNGFVCIRVDPGIKKDTGVAGDLLIQRKEKTTIASLFWRLDEAVEGEEILLGLIFYLYPSSEKMEDIFREMETKI
ncbi:MAG: hypothetical protein NC913_02880 [Candidatus Omnitrophica bacterium]|nr:hypothetical protein [Candidatus Omnitrophota bacterium]